VTGAARTIEETAAVGGRSKLVDLEKLVLFAIVCTRTAHAAFQRSRIFSGRVIAVCPHRDPLVALRRGAGLAETIRDGRVTILSTKV
jgi:hypothetical protein